MSERPGEMDERDVDERFASIVAGWDVSAGPTNAPDSPEPTDDARPDTPEDAPPQPSSGQEPTGPARPPAVNPSPLAGLVPASSWRVVQPPSDGDQDPPAPGVDDVDDEHFEPPAVELPPQEDLHFWGAVVGLVAGPLCLVYVAMARPFHSTRWFLAGLALSLVGFALLVLRSPAHRDGDDHDDGARV